MRINKYKKEEKMKEQSQKIRQWVSHGYEMDEVPRSETREKVGVKREEAEGLRGGSSGRISGDKEKLWRIIWAGKRH